MEAGRRGAASGASLHGLVEDSAARSPGTTAVVDGVRSLTYAELDGRAGAVARSLESWGVGPEVVVGLCVGRSAELVVGALGILKAGGSV
ncbi:MAG: AMP-binding protein, partial [Acidimicrobiales bacterium]